MSLLEEVNKSEAQPIHTMFDNRDVKCPYCGYEYVHFNAPHYISGEDDYKGSKIYDIGVRGDVLVIPFWCEEGHSWVLVLGSHKGHAVFKLVLTNVQDPEKG